MHSTELTLSEMSERIRDAKNAPLSHSKSFDMNPLGLTTYPGPSVRTSCELRVSLLICVHQTFCMSCSDIRAMLSPVTPKPALPALPVICLF